MIYLAAACVGALVVQSIAYGGLLLKLERRHGRRLDMLLDRLAHAQGRTWTPPPVDNGDQDEAPIYDSYDPFQQPD